MKTKKEIIEGIKKILIEDDAWQDDETHNIAIVAVCQNKETSINEVIMIEVSDDPRPMLNVISNAKLSMSNQTSDKFVRGIKRKFQAKDIENHSNDQ